MLTIRGTVERGCSHFSQRMRTHPDSFISATGERLYEGTINVRVAVELEINEHFRVPDPADTAQVLKFEVCRINGAWAYRIRPSLKGNERIGGHGDDVIEIASATFIPGAIEGSGVALEFFR
jgi:hypothetical protein